MNVRFYNAKILTMLQDDPIITGELWVKENRIIYVGKALNQDEVIQKQETFNIILEREVDVNQNLLMPGFKNAHTHSGMTFLRSYADDLPLQEWLTTRIFPFEAKLSPDDIYIFSKLAIAEYLTSGITANFDMYLAPDAIFQASIDCGFRTVQGGAVHNYLHSLKEMEEWYIKYNNHNELVSYIMGFHAEYTCSSELLKELAELSKQYKAPMFSHNSETQKEVDDCIQRYNLTPTGYFNKLGLFDYGGGGHHCVHMSKEDLEIFKEKDLTIVTNPASNAKLASGIAPINDALSMGINIAVGTDGPASNNALDMFREMYLVTALAKLREGDPAVVDAEKVLSMATVGGAKAMNLKDCDTLSEGKYADLIILDLHQPNMQPPNNLIKNIVYSASKQNVKLTMVNGKILYENGEFYLGEDIDKIYEKVSNRLSNIVG